MLETTLITEVELMEAVVETAAGSKPAVRYRVAAISEAGRVVFWFSEIAAKQLAEYFASLPGDAPA